MDLGPATGRWIDLRGDDAVRRIVAEFVRADVEIEPGPAGSVSVRIDSPSAPKVLAMVRLRVERGGGAVGLMDIYPRPTTVTMRECLPPTTERGDFWHTVVRLRVRIRMPAGIPADIRVMDGRVRDLR